MTVVALPAIDVRFAVPPDRVSSCHSHISPIRREPGRPTLRVCPAGLRACPIFKGPGRSYAPIHGRSSPPVNSVLVMAAAGARPPAVWNCLGPTMIRILPPRSSTTFEETDMAARRTAKAVTVNRSADVQQAPSSIHAGGKASFTGLEQGCRGSRLRSLAARPGMAGRHRRCRSGTRTIKHLRPRAALGRCRA